MSAGHRIIRNKQTGEVILARAKWCASFLCHFKGLQMASPLTDDEGVIFVYNSESRSRSIHMLFMRYSIGVVWLDGRGQVVDKKLAKPWRLVYAPRQAAQYYIEANPVILDRVELGDVLTFDEKARSQDDAR